LLLVLYIFSLLSTGSSAMKVRLPRVVSSDSINDENITVFVTGENIFRYNGSVVTLKDLSKILTEARGHRRRLLIKLDRRASVGRVVDLLDTARALGIGTINVVADREE
jgi:biopolymer transport protein ExbD